MELFPSVKFFFSLVIQQERQLTENIMINNKLLLNTLANQGNWKTQHNGGWKSQGRGKNYNQNNGKQYTCFHAKCWKFIDFNR